MVKSIVDLLRRARTRAQHDSCSAQPGSRTNRWLLASAELFEAVATDMDDYPDVQEKSDGVGITYLGHFEPSPIWTAAVTAARAYLGEEAAT